MQRNEKQELFKKAILNDFHANYQIGVNYYWGIDGFRKDLIQAKKHFLRAAVENWNNLPSLEIGSYKFRTAIHFVQLIDLELIYDAKMDIKRPADNIPDFPQLYEYLPCLKYYFSQSGLRCLLDDIEKEHGKFSSLEKHICMEKLPSIKNNYKQVGLFPGEIKDSLSNSSVNTSKPSLR